MPTSQSYGTAASGAWTNRANLTGPPDGVYASASSASVASDVRIAAFAEIPADAVLNQVVMGLRHSAAVVGRTVEVSVRTGLNTYRGATRVSATAVNAPTDTEIDVDPALVGVAGLKSTYFGIRLFSIGGAAPNVDAVWVKVTYNQHLDPPAPVTAARARRWTGTEWVPAVVRRGNGSEWVEAGQVARRDVAGWV